MELLKNLEGMTADEQMTAVLELQKSAMAHLEEQRQISIGKSAELVIQGLKKIKSDFEGKFDSLNYDIQSKVASLKNGEDGKDGLAGKDGPAGRDGLPGRDGKDGKDGQDGQDGQDGVSVVDARIDFDGSLVITLSTGREMNVGEVVAPDLAEKIKLVTSGGGTSQQVLDTLVDLQDQINVLTGIDGTLGTMAQQDANAVAITGGTINGVPLGTTTPAAGTFTTLTATGTSYLGGSSTSRSVQVDPVAGGTSTYTQFTRFVANNEQQIVAANTANLGLVATGGGGINMRTTASGQLQLRVADTSFAVNYAQVTGGATGNAPTISAQGSDTNIGMNLTTKGTGALSVNTGGGEQFRVTDTASANIYWAATGGVGGSGRATLTTAGNTTATSMQIVNHTAAPVILLTGNTEQLRIAHTASAVNFVQVTGAATSGAPTILAQGSDANVQINVLGKGTGFVVLGNNSRAAAAFTTTGSANNILITGTATTVAPSIAANGSDTNIDLNLNSKGTGVVRMSTGGGEQVRIAQPNADTNNGFLELRGSTTSTNGNYITASTNLYVSASSGNAIQFFSNGAGNVKQFQINHTASAVNFVQVTGAATGNTPAISAQGSDANVNLLVNPKGTGSFSVFANNGVQFRVTSVASAVNQLQVTGSIAGAAPIIAAVGSDTNIPLVLQPKGTGALQAQQTDSTATGGNARGANAVDWQTSRNAASQVASGTLSVLGGGNRNTVPGFNATVAGGDTNSATNNYTFVGGGGGNIAGQSHSSVVGGYTNTAGGFLNFIGGGFTNSGTSGAIVTTQSATMNGTTTVTLSGSNASIRVGQLITGTNIQVFPFTYVAAISGTTLTLSQAASGSGTATLSFFTPHGVVVGGGNNQATGSYSFIGGGGDAGTAANRNLASGDWSVVGGGRANTANNLLSAVLSGVSNTASGIGSVVCGGGTFGSITQISGNIASGLTSFVGSGFNNLSSSNGSFVGAGAVNTANGIYSAVVAGNGGTTRSIWGNHVVPTLNPFAAQGTCQSATLVVGAQTTNATATVLTCNGAAAITTNQVILPNNSAYYFRGTVIANVTGGGNTKSWTIEGAIKRGANAASTTLVGVTVMSPFGDVGAATWTIAAAADTTNGGLQITFTGQAATTIRVVAKLETTEVTF
jgi:hypothetical protein